MISPLAALGAVIAGAGITLLEFNESLREKFAGLQLVDLRNSSTRVALRAAGIWGASRVFAVALTLNIAPFFLVLPLHELSEPLRKLVGLSTRTDLRGAQVILLGLMALLALKGGRFLYSVRNLERERTRVRTSKLDRKPEAKASRLMRAAQLATVLGPVYSALYEVLYARWFETRVQYVMAALTAELDQKFGREVVIRVFNTPELLQLVGALRHRKTDQTSTREVLKTMITAHKQDVSGLLSRLLDASGRQERRKLLRYFVWKQEKVEYRGASHDCTVSVESLGGFDVVAAIRPEFGEPIRVMHRNSSLDGTVTHVTGRSDGRALIGVKLNERMPEQLLTFCTVGEAET